MSIKKCTLFFDGRQSGWTESYYTDTGDSHEEVMKRLNRLASDRSALLGAECMVKALRVSSEGIKNDSMLRYVRYRGNLQKPSVQKDVCLMVRCENGARTKWSNKYLRGIWDEVESEHGLYVGRANVAWADAFDTYAARLVADSWGWITQEISATYAITSIARSTSEDTLVYTLADEPFTPADVVAGTKYRVRVTGVNGQSSANGLHVVKAINTNKVETVHALAAGKYRFGGFMKTYTYPFADIVSAADTKIVSRETGAPLLESRGRQRAKPKA